MINFDFFYLITFEWLMVSAGNLVCGRFISFQKGRKILTLQTFGCPNDNVLHNNEQQMTSCTTM